MNLFKKKSKPGTIELIDWSKTTLLNVKIFHLTLWNATMKYICEKPSKLAAMTHIPSNGNGVRVRLTPNTPQIKIAEFETDNDCRAFYDFLSKIVKNPDTCKIYYKCL